VRYYLDEDVAVQVAPALRALGLDVLTTRDANQLQAPDDDQLAFAAAAQRVIVTRNVRDFVRLTPLFEAQSKPHAGVLLVTTAFAERDYGGLARAIARYDREHPQGMTAYQADYRKRA
jgi:predicted nuclease of predicted toxin-antitoxin system